MVRAELQDDKITVLWIWLQVLAEILLRFTEAVHTGKKLVYKFQIHSSVCLIVTGGQQTHMLYSLHIQVQRLPILLLWNSLSQRAQTAVWLRVNWTHHRVLAVFWTSSSFLQISLFACSPPGATSLAVAMHDLLPFVCLANHPGHSHGDGSYPPGQRKGEQLIIIPPPWSAPFPEF